MEFAAVEQALEEAAQRGVFPGAVLLVSRNGDSGEAFRRMLEEAEPRPGAEPEPAPAITDPNPSAPSDAAESRSPAVSVEPCPAPDAAARRQAP